MDYKALAARTDVRILLVVVLLGGGANVVYWLSRRAPIIYDTSASKSSPFGSVTRPIPSASTSLLWVVSAQTKLPPIFDYIIAPGFLPIAVLFPIEGDASPEQTAQHSTVIAVGFILNILIYFFLIYGILLYREYRKRARASNTL